MLPGTEIGLPRHGTLYGVTVAVLSVAGATVLRAALDPILTGLPFITYVLAVVVAGWLGGRAAGILAIAGSVVAADYFFLEPRGSFAIASMAGRVSGAAFVLVAFCLLAVVFAWRRAQSRLLRAQRVFAQAGAMAHLGAWAIEISDPGNLSANPLFWSDETYRIFGYEPRSIRATNELFYAHLHPEDRQRVADAMNAALTERRAYAVEHRIVRQDGSERVVDEHAEIEFDARGRACWIVGAVQDVTEQRRTEHTLREASDRLRRILEHIHDALIIDDLDGRLVFANDRFLDMFGFRREELASIRLEDYVAPEYRDVLRDRHDRRMRGERVPEQFEYIGMTRDGRRMWLEVDVVPVLDEGGMAIGTQSALRDVTDRKIAGDALRASEETARRRAEELERLMGVAKRLEEELRQNADQLAEANRLKDEFIATVSHELRTPLNAILGWAELLRERRLDRAGEERAVEVIAGNARRQAQLIEDLLDMSRIVAGKLRLDPRSIDPAGPVHAAIEAVLPSARAKGVAVRPPAPTADVQVFADAARLQQIVWNLLTNAVKFTPQGGEVLVHVQPRAGEVDIVVRDTGCGIAPAFLPHVFDRFRQADSRSTRAHAGLGIGLSIVKHLVEAQGGRVRAESAGENQGSTFVVTLPVQNALDDRRHGGGVARQAAPGRPATLPQALRGVRVLTVDDEPDARELTRALLRQHGAEVLTAESVDEAMQAVARWKPDVLVVDIAMPKADGFALLERLTETGGECASIPAIALSAYAREEDRLRGVACGFRHYLTKPVDEAALLHAVGDVAGSRSTGLPPSARDDVRRATGGPP